MRWRDEAACKDLPSDLFFPPLFKEERLAPEPHYYNLGKLACEVCPVKARCLVDGEDEEFGLWGGLTPKERGGKPVKRPNRILTMDKVDYLSALGPQPDIHDLQEIIRPHLERRKKVVDSEDESD